MKTIPLTQGRVALVDDTDFEWLNQRKWYAIHDHNSFYAIRNITVAKNKRRTEWMHRLILGLQRDDKRQCDHIDNNGLNNVRSNLRICTNQQNQRSSRKRTRGTSKYKGVFWNYANSKWLSAIRTKKEQIHLGCFDSEIEAAQAYDSAALKYHGRFALTNEMLGLLPIIKLGQERPMAELNEIHDDKHEDKHEDKT